MTTNIDKEAHITGFLQEITDVVGKYFGSCVGVDSCEHNLVDYTIHRGQVGNSATGIDLSFRFETIPVITQIAKDN